MIQMSLYQLRQYIRDMPADEILSFNFDPEVVNKDETEQRSTRKQPVPAYGSSDQAGNRNDALL